MKFLDRFRRRQKEKAEKKNQESETVKTGEEGAAKMPKPAEEEMAGRTAYVLRAPHITEKGARLGHQNQYVFRIAEHATKTDIASAFRSLYGMQPLRVRMISLPRKPRRLGRTQGFKAGYRKAIVTLPKGKTIEMMPR